MSAAVLRRAASAVGPIPLGVGLALALLAVLVVAAMGADWLAPFDPTRQTLLQRLRPPGHATAAGAVYRLGTDELGRDLLSRVLHGARVSILVALLSVGLSIVVGTLLGMIAAWRRGWVEILIMRLVDTMLSIPAILLAVLTVAVLGPGFLKVVMVLGFTRWPRYTRVAYGQTLQVASLPYIRAAELAGASSARILLRHILPNIAGPLLVVATAEFGLMILFEASLSFLGLGIQPPTPSLGSILSSGRQYLDRAWWLTLVPGATLFALVLSVNVFGDWLRDRLDPRSRSR